MLDEISVDGGLQVGDRAEDTAADALPGHLGKEILDSVEPGGRGRGEVEGPTRMTAQPGQHFGMLVGGIVVEDDMDRLIGRAVALDSIEKSNEFEMAVALHAAADHGAVERKVPADKPIHAVLDNYATHKHPRVLAWLSRHPRWTFHFAPTSASWLNAVENFLSKMTRQRIRRGVFRSIADLQAAINTYLAEHNANPKRFVWTKSADTILAKLDRLPVSSESA